MGDRDVGFAICRGENDPGSSDEPVGRGLRPGEAAEFFPFHLAQGEGAFLTATRVGHDPRSNLVRESSSFRHSM
jgi:hypothetical protein